MTFASLLLASALASPEILGLRCERTDKGTVLKVLATSAIGSVARETSGERLTLVIPATLASPDLPLPEALPPIRALTLEPDAERTVLRLEVMPGTTLESRSEGTLLELTMNAPGAGEAPARPQDVEQLYQLLFPLHAARTEPTSAGPEADSSPTGVFRLGPFAIKPGLQFRYVNAESSFLDTPAPVDASYLEIQPSLALTAEREILGARMSASYEPRFRTGAEGIPVLGQPSHFVNASVDIPARHWLWFSVADQWSQGSLETQVVDPGREYFFDIGRFERNQVSLGLRTETSSRFDLSTVVAFADEELEPGSGYFDNDRRLWSSELRYELTPLVNLALGYSYEHVPPPLRRPLVESTAHTVGLRMTGELSPVMRLDAGVSFRSQEHPQALPEGNSYSGITYGASLVRHLPSGAEIRLGADRSTQLSAFEQNAFYVSNGVSASVKLPTVLKIEASGSVSYQHNSYELPASGLAEPRLDKLLGWTLGLARPLTRWCYLRVDYARDERDSNVSAFTTHSEAFVAQLGLTLPNRK